MGTTGGSGSDAAAVLFSGGKDSTLAAYVHHRRGDFLHLVSFDSGLGYGREIRDLRLTELAAVLGADSFEATTIRNYGLVRRMCFSKLADDVRQDGYHLILLGEAFAMIARAVDFCRFRGLTTIVFGATGYQEHLPEQQPLAVEFFREFCAGHGVELSTPVYAYKDENTVKDELVDAGLSDKSLEGSTLLADIEDHYDPETVLRYLERKRGIAAEYLERVDRISSPTG
jgi:diphthamide synthase (EF-2-diphthine--ammonia ligase)